MPSFQRVLRVACQLLALSLLCPVAILAGEAVRKYQPLDWEWKKAEIAELKELAQQVKTDPADGSLTLETANWRIRTWHTPLFTAQAGKYMELFSEVFFKAFILKGERGFQGFKPELRIHPSRDSYLATGAAQWSAGVNMARWTVSGGKVTPEITLHTCFPYQKGENGKEGSKGKKGGGKGAAEPVFGSKVPLGTIQHEATHCLLQCIYGPMVIPMWLNEGAASYYEGWPLRQRISEEGESPKDVEARNKRRSHSPGPRELSAQFRQRKDAPIPTLEELTSANGPAEFYCDNGGPRTRLNYNLAESFIDFLMNSRNRRPLMLAILERVKEQQGRAEPGKPFVTEAEIAEHEKDWLEFLQARWGVKLPAAPLKERLRALKEKERAGKGGNP
ncbi:MAG: hypothetical protein J6333_08390 [Planctomycetes bacterium]|nr:hypothetical protein [Planctomycetota bacterium]